MVSVEEHALEFARRAKAGESPSVSVSKKHAESFLAVLATQGLRFARECLDQISDPSLKTVIETLFFSTLAGAGAGAVVGVLVAGKKGAKVGAAVGTGLGFAAGYTALSLKARQQGDKVLLTIA